MGKRRSGSGNDGGVWCITDDGVWYLSSEACSNQCSTWQPITNPKDVAPLLFKAMEDVETDPKVISDLWAFVEYDGEFLKRWFLKLREKWEAKLPETDDDATKIVWYALVDLLHNGLVPGSVIQGILSHYKLPPLTAVDGGNFFPSGPKLSESIRAPDDYYDCPTDDEAFCTKQADGNDGGVFYSTDGGAFDSTDGGVWCISDDGVWYRSSEACNQCSTWQPITNPKDVAPLLFKAMEDVETDPKVISDLWAFVEYDGEFLKRWFLKLREKWEAKLPETDDDATKIVWYSLVDLLHNGLVPGSVIQGILSHYKLPPLTAVDGGNFFPSGPKLSERIRVPDDYYDYYLPDDEAFCADQAGLEYDTP